VAQTEQFKAERDARRNDRIAREERATLGPLPGGGSAVLRVSIPVKVGGFTGQRDQWEETERDFNVVIRADGKLIFKDVGDGTQITIDRAGLAAAVAVLEDYLG
jgi:hypothetical protein